MGKNKTGLKIVPALKIFIFILIITTISSLLFISLSCKNESESKGTTEAKISTGQTSNETSDETTAATTVGTTASETTSTTVTETTQEAIPQEIQDLIKSADNYYKDGEYALAVKSYRNAELAIKNSKLSAEKQKELIDEFSANYAKAKDIVDTARMHYGNAMQLEYEGRYDEAKKELKAALAIYPKYKDAIDELANLESIMGLN
jgi:tetratricopeptide (TPR) repeat protein